MSSKSGDEIITFNEQIGREPILSFRVEKLGKQAFKMLPKTTLNRKSSAGISDQSISERVPSINRYFVVHRRRLALIL
jgi:hypothetical protein